MATIDNRIVQLEFKNAAFAQAIAATLEALKTLNEALKTVGAENSFADVSDDAASMKEKVGTAIQSAVAALPALGAKAGQIAGRLGEAGAKMATALLPIGKAAEEASKKIEQVGNSGDNFGRISAAAQRVNLAPITASVEGVSAKFLALSTIAVTALSRITDKAITTGTALLNGLSLEQVTSGFGEYELKLGSIQTIMAGTGESLATVNRYLDELNTYADRTIYSFADMTQNIGKFTNAGVDLDTAVKSIQGVAQVAAVSGANTNEASRAMYNFAQALSKGYVQLIDWKSIELANMGTVEFKQQLVDAAVAMGTLTKEGNKYVTTAGSEIGPKMEGFNDALTDQFLTTEVLTSTLAKYTDETTELGKKAFAASSDIKTLTQLFDVLKESIGSGFARSFEILIGDFDEAKALFTQLGNVLVGTADKISEARNTMLESFKLLGGRDLLIQSLGNAFKYLGDILEPIREAFRDVFPPQTAESLFALTQRFSQFIQRLKPSQQTIMQVKRIFEGLFSAVKIGLEFIKALGRTVADFFRALGFGQGQFLEFLASMGDFVTGLRDGLVEGEGLKNFFASLDFGKALKTDSLVSAGNTIKNFFVGMWETIKSIGVKISEWFNSLGEIITNTIDPSVFDATGKALQFGVLGALGLAIGKFLKNGFNFNIGSGGFFDGITDALEGFAKVLTAMQDNLRAGSLLKIAAAIGILALSLAVLAAIDASALARASGAMAGLFAQLTAATYALKAISIGLSPVQIAVTAAGMVLIAGAMFLLAGAMKKIGELDIDQIGKGLYGVASGLTIFVLAVNRINSGGGLVKAGAAMILFAIAMRILANALRAMGSLDVDVIGKGLYGMGSSLVVIAAALRLMPSSIFANAAGVLAIAIALRVMANAMEAFGSLDMDTIGKGLYAMASSLVLIGVAMRIMPKNMLLTAGSLILVGIALNVIAMAVRSFAAMTWDEIGKGLYTIAAALVLIGIAAKAMTTGIVGAVAIILLSAALSILASALQKFSSLSWGEMLKGFVGLAGALLILIGAAALMAAVGPALLLAGVALLLLGAGVAALGVGAIATAKAIQIFANVGMRGVDALIQAFRALFRVFPELAQAIIDTLVVILEGFPALLEPIKNFVLELLDVLIEIIPKAVETVIIFVQQVLLALRELVPDFIATGLEILVAFLQGVRDNIAQVATLAVEIIAGFIDGLAQGLPTLVESVVNFLVTALTEVAGQMGETAPTIMITIGTAFLEGFLIGMEEAWKKVVDFIKSIPEKILNWIKSGFGIFSPSRKMKVIGLDVLLGFLNGITQMAQRVFSWFRALPGVILGFFASAATWLLQMGMNIFSGLWNGIKNIAASVWGWFREIPGKIKGFFSGAIGWLLDMGKRIINGLWNGIKNIASDVWGWFRDLPGKIVGLIPNPLGILAGIGGKIMDGLFNGLKGAWNAGKSFLGGIGGAIKNLKGPPEKDAVLLVPIGRLIFRGLFKGMNEGWDETADWLSKINPANEMDDDAIARSFKEITDRIGSSLEGLDLSPTITPVVDLTEIERGFDRVRELTPSVSVGAADAISTSVNASADDTIDTATGRGGVVFNQTINAPEQLSTTEVYRQTRNQITLAKEELEIP